MESEDDDSIDSLLKELWQELMKEKKFGIDVIKITSTEEDRKIIEYIKKNKTNESFAFNRDEISIGTGIPINRLPYTAVGEPASRADGYEVGVSRQSYTSIIKIPNIEYILLDGKIWFTYITIWERTIRILRTIKNIFEVR